MTFTPRSSSPGGYSRKPSGDRGSFGPRKTFGGKPPFGDRPSFGDRGPRPSFGERKQFGDRPSFGSRPPFKKFGDKPSFGDRGPRPSFGERKPFGDRPSFGDRGPRPSFGERKQFGDRPSFGSRPPFKKFGDKPSFGDRGPRPSFGERKPFGDRPSFGDRGPRPSFGERKQFGDRPSFGSRPPFKKFGDKPSFGDRGPRPSFGEREERAPREQQNEDAEGRFPMSPRGRNVERSFTNDFDKKPSRKAELPTLMNNVMANATNEADALTPRKQKGYMRTAQGMEQTTAATTSWGDVAHWYDNHLENEEDTYHRQVILPNLTRLVAPKEGERILEIACGQGFFARRFQEMVPEARIEGIDLGEDLIAIAKERAPQMNFRLDNAEEMTTCTDRSYETVYCVLAIQNIGNLDKLIEQAERILVPGGTFHIVMNHPVLRIPKETSWEFVEDKGVQARRVDAYLSPANSAMVMHPGMANSPQTISFHRSLQSYFKSLAKFDFSVDRLEEWISHKTSDSGPRAAAENKARKEIPMFMYLRVKKA